MADRPRHRRRPIRPRGLTAGARRATSCAPWHSRRRGQPVRRRRRVALLPGGDQLPRPLARLTAREREVLDILATGATNRAIAGRLFITEKTVSVHVTNLMAKLDVSNRGEAAALARRLAPLE